MSFLSLLLTKDMCSICKLNLLKCMLDKASVFALTAVAVIAVVVFVIAVFAIDFTVSIANVVIVAAAFL
jgi:hypothetical protein